MNILITGGAGFIGFNLTKKLCDLQSNAIIALDNLNSYYNPSLKIDRLKSLGFQFTRDTEIAYNYCHNSKRFNNLSFFKINLEDKESLFKLFSTKKIDMVIHFAAQAGVRHSITNPDDYINSNIIGFYNILEACRIYNINKLLYASSSSVYGISNNSPFSENQLVDKPESLYAATKRSNELFAYTYSKLYAIKAIGLRFFTVYGPWGRPDMAYFKFTESILAELPIDIYNNGCLKRDFTYIDDVVEAVCRLISVMDSNTINAHEIVNIGNNTPIGLNDFVSTLENVVQKKAIKNYIAMQQGDVYKTYANTDKIKKLTHFKPNTSIEDGLRSFYNWYTSYYKIN